MERIVRAACLTSLACACSLSVSALESAIPEITVPLKDKAPTMDGVIEPEEWRGTARVIGFMRGGMHMENREAIFHVGCNGKTLFLAVRTELPPTGDLVARSKPAGNADRPAYRDDSLEFWIDPHKTRTEGDRRYFQIVVNSVGALYDVAFDPANEQQRANTTWRVDWETGSSLHDGWWDFECAIPLASIGASPADLKHPWGLRIGRNWQRPGPQTSWEPRSYAFDDQSSMPVVHWVDAGVVPQQTQLRDPKQGNPNVALNLRNTADQPKTVAVDLYQQSASSPPRTVKQTVTVQPGEVETVQVTDGTTGGGRAETRIELRDAGTDDILFLRAFTWDLNRPEVRWKVSEDDARAVVLDIAYYPYHNKLKTRIDIGGLERPDAITGVNLIVNRKDNGKTVARGTFPTLKDHSAATVLDLPDLPDGEYIVQTVLNGPGAPEEPTTQTFQRKHFEWEHNRLGMIEGVIPPFTPLQTEDNTLTCVLREHRLNGLGLWDQVNAEGVDLLARPMTLHAEVNGKEVSVNPVTEGVTFTRKTEAEVDYKTSWTAGPLTGETNVTCEMDGAMIVDLTLNMDDNASLDALDLVIPLKTEEAPLMHVCTDGLRFNYAGAAPRGEGLVWESKQASRRFLQGTFIPYIWLGGPSRGLAWFADSDRDWLVDDELSTHEIRREGDITKLVVRFVTRPGTPRRTHRIRFALQASPTKPMPTEPVHWRKWMFGSNCGGHAFNIRFLGACYYWGSKNPYQDVYPRDKEFYIYDVLADIRRTGTVDEERIAKFLSGFDEANTKGGRYYDSIHWTVRALKGKPDAVVPYTNARGAAGPEYAVFEDEWHRAAYTSRKAQPVCYDASPVQSYQDYCLFYFNKMVESGMADGIYFDDIFLQANSDVVSGGAYCDDNGHLRPSADLFAMREYLKRVQILCCQKGIPWVNIAHMTNTQILPITTWVGINMDWEWKYGSNDFQERFSRDLIRTETLGLQSGCRPTQLGGIHGVPWNSPQHKWVERTQFATNIVHEIQTISATSVANTAMAVLYDFGYGEPDCQVYQYWRKEFPAKIEGLDAEALVLRRNGQALIVVSSFGEGGKGVLKLDRKHLGLADNGRFSDVEKNAVLNAAGENGCHFEIKKHDFKIIRYAAGNTAE